MNAWIVLATTIVSGVIALVSWLLSDKRRLRQLEIDIKTWEGKKNAALAKGDTDGLNYAVGMLLELRSEQTHILTGK